MPHTPRCRLVAAALATLVSLLATLITAPAVSSSPPPTAQPYAGYLFVYFTGEGTADGEQIHFARSRGNNPLAWDELNGGKPVLTSSLGEQGVRDPFIIRSPQGDRFYLLATDLRIYQGKGWDYEQRHGSRSIMIWESPDLVHWSAPRSVGVSPPTAGNTWAPEAYWDAKTSQYVVFWASKLYSADDPDHTGNSYNRMMYVTTKDFVHFSEAKVWNDPDHSVIDSTVIEHNGSYYRFTKDERDNAAANPCGRFITEESSTDLLDRSWDFVADCIGKATADSPGISQGEGPTVFKSNTENKWYLFIDEFGGRGYVPFETTDLASGKRTMSSNYQLPSSPRHGTVLPVTQAEYDRLSAPVPPALSTADGLVAHWPLRGSAVDATGHGYDGTLSGDVRWGDGLQFGATNGFVALPPNLLAGTSAVTVSADVWVDPAQETPYFLYGFGNTSTAGQGDGYVFATGGTEDEGFRAAIASGNWSTEQEARSVGGLPRGSWQKVTLTIDRSTEELYLNGTEVARNAAVSIKPGDLGGGRTLTNYLGRSLYAADPYFKGKMRDVRLYNRALSASEVAALGSPRAS